MATARIVRRLAATTAVLLSLGTALLAGPAHAASTDPPVDGTPNTYTVDVDPIAIDSNYTVFSGSMKVFHDGEHVRGVLTGMVNATQADRCIRLAVTFFYADGTYDNIAHDNYPYPCGTSQTSVTISSPMDKDIVKYHYATRAITSSGAFTGSASVEGLVGDAPASVGSCSQLDDDTVSSGGKDVPAFKGTVVYGCVTSSGNTVATVSGTLDKRQVPAGSAGAVDITFSYADGSTGTVRNPGGSPKLVSDGTGGSYPLFSAGASSDPTKDVRSVTVRTLSQQTSGFHMTTFAPSPGTSWFGTFDYS